jgi:hypothetical protein
MATAAVESAPGLIGPITLGMKRTGKRSAGKPHAAFEEAGAGNGPTVRLVRHSQRKRGATDRPDLRGTAPVLDPTTEGFDTADLKDAKELLNELSEGH